MVKSFIRNERYKLLATFLVAGFFLYFWINGPFRQIEETISLEIISTIYSDPKMVGETGIAEQGFGTIKDDWTSGHGYGLIRDKRKLKTYGLVASEELNPGLSGKLAVQMLEHSREIFPEANAEVRNSMEMYYVRVALPGEDLLYIESTDIITNIRGYAGPVNIGIFVSGDGSIHSLHHISSRETESYLRKIQNKGFYDQLNQKPIRGEVNVDAVSGATLTCEAIAQTASRLVNEATPYPLINITDVDEMDSFSLEADLSHFW